MKRFKSVLATFIGITIVTSTFPTVSFADTYNPEKVEFPEKISFEDGEPVLWSESFSSIEVVSDQGVSEGSKSLKVTFPTTKQWPGVKFTAPEGKEWKFSKDKTFGFTMSNPNLTAQSFFVKINYGDLSAGDNSITYEASIPAKKLLENFYIPVSGDSAVDWGMATLVPGPAGSVCSFSYNTGSVPEGADISMVTIWKNTPDEELSLYVDDVKEINNPDTDVSYLNGIIDEFGQYTKQQWNDKVTDLNDLLEKSKASNEKTVKDFKDYNKDGKLTKFGGCKDESLKKEAKGKFYVDKIGDKWTMIDPDGYPFFSTGPAIMRLEDQMTWVSGREQMFTNIPAKDGPLGSHYGTAENCSRSPRKLASGDTFNFYSANLERKYGEDYATKWRDESVMRLKDWGFTSLGNWADPDLFFGKGEETKMPYVANGWINKGDYQKIDADAWGSLADPYDPEFKVSAEDMAKSVAATGVNDDKWCYGIYVDNELPWGPQADSARKYMIVTNVMKSKADESYAKAAFVSLLKEKYNNKIADLNTAWGTSIDSFDELKDSYTGNISAEDKDFLQYNIAKQYYKTVSKVLDTYLPDLMYLGSRLAEWGVSENIVKACSEYADVVSFNCYKDTINQPWMYTNTFDKPIIIGEFHFNAMDHGQFAPGLCPVETQTDRGESYKKYVTSALQNDKFVGVQWFQYYDEPTLGRAWDGENSNTGLVDVTDQPYDELVTAAKDINSKAYSIKFSSKMATSLNLSSNSVALTKTDNTATVVATFMPEGAVKSALKWESSNTRVATVDENTGKITAVGNGSCTIKATSKINSFVTASCAVNVTGFDTVVNNTYIKEGFDNGATSQVWDFKDKTCSNDDTKIIVDPNDANNYVYQINTTENSGTWANLVRFGFNAAPVDMTGLKFKMDIINPNDYDMPNFVITFSDANGNNHSFYAGVDKNSTKTAVFDDTDTAVDNDTTGKVFDYSKVQWITLWYGLDLGKADMKYYVDNITIGSPAKVTIPEISFEETEDATKYKNYNTTNVESQIVSENATDGTKALKVTKTSTEGNSWDYATFIECPDGVWSLDKNLNIDFYNPNDFALNIATNFYNPMFAQEDAVYTNIPAKSKATVTINPDKFATVKSDDIKSFKFWVNDDNKNAVPYSYYVDNISYSKEVASCAQTVKINKSSIALNKESSSETLTATMTPADVDDTIIWESSNTLVATVDETGKVKACGNGTATITAKSSKNQFAVDSCSVNVTGLEGLCTVKFNTLCMDIDIDNQFVSPGAKVKAPVVDMSRDGFEFTGWYSDSKATEKFDFDKAITANTTIFAGWKEIVVPSEDNKDVPTTDEKDVNSSKVNNPKTKGDSVRSLLALSVAMLFAIEPLAHKKIKSLISK